MVNKSLSRGMQGEPPPIDESWWTALLTEEAIPHAGMDGNASSLVARKGTRQVQVNWEKAHQVYEFDQTIKLKVTGYNRGGLLVEGQDLQGFVPVSHLVQLPCNSSEDDREKLLGGYLDCILNLKVIECDPARGRVVFSERAALSEPGRRTLLLDSLQQGDQIWGMVTNITDFGVFVDLGGLEGLIHVSELSWGRVHHPSDLVRVGQKVQVYVIQVDRERLRVALSLKRLSQNPWETVEARYQSGQIIEATVTSVMPFGAFARLEDGLDGLIHVSEMSRTGELVNPEEVVSSGQRVLVRILHIDAGRQRLGLSLVFEQQM